MIFFFQSGGIWTGSLEGKFEIDTHIEDYNVGETWRLTM